MARGAALPAIGPVPTMDGEARAAKQRSVVGSGRSSRGENRAPPKRGPVLGLASGWTQKSMPPMPPSRARASPGAFSGLSATTASVVRNSAAMEAAFCSARAGHLGGVDDALGDHVDVLAGGRVEAVARGQAAHLLRHDAALEAGVDRDLLERGLGGDLHDRSHRWPRRPRGRACRTPRRAACTSATPPPATMPSSTAAFALRTASSMRCLRSLSSTSVAAPTLITATPPASLARRSCSFSRS